MGILSVIRDLLGIEDREEKEKKNKAEQEKYGTTQPVEAPASQEEKAAKERKWKDPDEDMKYVCQGGKIQCAYCSTPIADILPTTTQVMLQDKPYVTVNDKDGKTNFAFTGTCNHPSQQKPSAPPPPCKMVISLGMWKDYSETKIDVYNALLVKSTIPCMISGEDLKITHSGQMAVLTEIEPDVKKNPKIMEFYWTNEQKEQIEVLEIEDKAFVFIKVKDYEPDDEIEITIEDGEGNDILPGQKTVTIKGKPDTRGELWIEAYNYNT